MSEGPRKDLNDAPDRDALDLNRSRFEPAGERLRSKPRQESDGDELSDDPFDYTGKQPARPDYGTDGIGEEVSPYSQDVDDDDSNSEDGYSEETNSDADESDADESDADESDADESDADESDADESDADESDADEHEPAHQGPDRDPYADRYVSPGEGGDHLTDWVPQSEAAETSSDSDGLTPRSTDQPESGPPAEETPSPPGDDTPPPPETPTPRHHPDDLDPDADDDGPVDSQAPQQQTRDVDLSIDTVVAPEPGAVVEGRAREHDPIDDPADLDAPEPVVADRPAQLIDDPVPTDDFGGGAVATAGPDTAPADEGFGSGAAAPSVPTTHAEVEIVRIDPVIEPELPEPAPANVDMDIPDLAEPEPSVVFEPNDEPVTLDNPAEVDFID